MKLICSICLAILIALACTEKADVKSAKMEKEGKMKALIIDGENNHVIFPKSTMMMKDYLEETGMFTVDIYRTKYIWQGGKRVAGDGFFELLDLYPLEDGVDRTLVDEPQPDPDFSPNFSEYDLVVSNFGWKASNWPEQTKKNFEAFVASGGGLMVTHAADNSWGDWEAYNKMIGVGGWGGRNTASGPYVYYDKNEELKYDQSEGKCGSHGPQSEFVVKTRAADHPIMKGLPTQWMHTKDELYDRLRGPAENMTVLATAFSSKEGKGTDRHEPVLMAIDYGEGRVFHSTLGHMDYSLECVGFITTFQRAAEWAATGEVTQVIPNDFPSKEKSSTRKWGK